MCLKYLFKKKHFISGILTHGELLLSRLFQPVPYGTKPEGRLATFTSTAGQRPPLNSSVTSIAPSTATQAAQLRGKAPVTTGANTPTSHGKIFQKDGGI